MKKLSFQKLVFVWICMAIGLPSNVWRDSETNHGIQDMNAAYGAEPNSRVAANSVGASSGMLAFDKDPNATDRARIVLKKFEITETTIDVVYEIRNETDHEIWICDGLMEGQYSDSYYEVSRDAAAQRLVVKKHINIPVIGLVDWYFPPFGVYQRLPAGEKHLSSFSRSLPLHRYSSSWTGSETPEIVDLTGMVIYVHYYNGDLPGLIRSLLTDADRFIGKLPSDWHDSPDTERILEYFPGLVLKYYFGSEGLELFNENYSEDIRNGKLSMAYYKYEFLKDEEVLKLTVDGVSIPFDIWNAKEH
ncbi:MAG: hypothetical protein K9N55_06110 [Phycisphaerae bacterium]|nr:hypothetical protein [Phycisphaerae bacterium]